MFVCTIVLVKRESSPSVYNRIAVVAKRKLYLLKHNVRGACARRANSD